ncbi:hypothetical protein, partial [Mycobacterium paragordonae]|uniref:hypothetical protein n=1 Tax=Mycobacterium paragordonae TaxID=1389713 RepID=UPI0018CBF664
NDGRKICESLRMIEKGGKKDRGVEDGEDEKKKKNEVERVKGGCDEVVGRRDGSKKRKGSGRGNKKRSRRRRKVNKKKGINNKEIKGMEKKKSVGKRNMRIKIEKREIEDVGMMNRKRKIRGVGEKNGREIKIKRKMIMQENDMERKRMKIGKDGRSE